MSLPPITDLADMKLILIENSTTTFALNDVKTITHTSPFSRLCLIEMLVYIPTAGNFVPNELTIDDIPMLSNVAGASTATKMYYQNGHQFLGLPATLGGATMWTWFRKTIALKLTNSVAGGDVNLKIWAWVHRDLENKFLSVATLQG